MTGRNYLLRFVGPIAFTSLLLFSLCTLAAVYLYRQHAGAAEVLGEDIGSRRAAANLEESLTDLLALHRDQADRVSSLHDRIRTHLTEIQEFADKDDERVLVRALVASFSTYEDLWQAGMARQPPERDRAMKQALVELESRTLRYCQDLRRYNTQQIEQSEKAHRRTVRWMAWGLAGVSGAGSLVGLLLGYVVARGLRQSIHRLQIRVRDAADKLGQDLPAVELTEEDALDRLHEQMHGVVEQIQQVVQKLQQREREVLRAEQLAAVGQLAAGVAHELRNPLTSIKMLVQASREEKTGVGTEDLNIIELEIRRMERSLKTFLEFARPPRLERSAADLVPIVERTLSLIRGRASRQCVEVRFVRPDGPVPLEADAEQLQQVFINLALNALDVMPRGGLLEFVLTVAGDDHLEVAVSDTGPGIALELMPRLFEPFVSGKETGLGLGLVVSRRILEGHGGGVRAFNRPESGACFVVRLPAGLPARGDAEVVRDASPAVIGPRP